MKEETVYKNLTFKHTPVKGFTSVVLPVYRDAAGLAQTLDSFRNQTMPASEFEVIVCNDGGQAEISGLCKQYNVLEIVITPNRGSYFARNRGLEKTRGEYVAFVDADVTVPRDWIENGKKELQSVDYAGGPVIIDESKVTEPAHVYESLYGFPGEKFFHEQHFCVTANLFVKRSVIEEIGAFDERLRSGGDNEFGRRVYSSGKFRQRYSNDLTVLHPPRGFNDLIKKGVRLHAGRTRLNELYPDRYNYQTPHSGDLIMSMLLPPRLTSVNKIFNNDRTFSFFRKYTFLWKYKFYMQLNLYKLYYMAGRKNGR